MPCAALQTEFKRSAKPCRRLATSMSKWLVLTVIGLSHVCVTSVEGADAANSVVFLVSSRQASSLEPNAAGLATVFLTDGATREFSLAWTIALEANAPKIDDFDVTYECEDLAVLDGNSDCHVDVAQADLATVDEIGVSAERTLFDVKVLCVARRFPGIANCRLSASPKPGMLSDKLTSPASQVVIAGLAFYDLGGVDDEGRVSKDTSIYTGADRLYAEPNYLEADTAPVLFGVRMYLPDGTRSVGEDAGNVLNEAKLSVTETEPIFLYDESSCQPGNFSRAKGSQEAGTFELAPAETCGFGTAPNSNGTDALVGVRLRPYKAGEKTVRFEWSDFGSEDTQLAPYSQVITIRVDGTGVPPPVVVEVGLRTRKEDLAGVPCNRAEEGLLVRMYNVESATRILLRIFEPKLAGSSATLLEWVEDGAAFVYDEETDSSAGFFKNRGGSGRNLSYTLAASFGPLRVNERDSILPESASAVKTLSFSDPASVALVNPAVLDFQGGSVWLVGEFEGLLVEKNDRILLDGKELAEKSILAINSTHIEVDVPGVSESDGTAKIAVQVEVCGVLSNAVTLVYGVVPMASIWSLDVSPLQAENNTTERAFLLPYSVNDIVFVADSASGNLGHSYHWELKDKNDVAVDVGDVAVDLPTFTLDTALLYDTENDYSLHLFLKNSAGNDTAIVLLRGSPAGAVVVAVSIYPVPMQRGSELSGPTLVHSSVEVYGKDLVSDNSRVVLEWRYADKLYLVEGINASNSIPFDDETTGPALFGRQLSIASKDIAVGTSRVSLRAYIDTDPAKRGEAVTNLVVAESRFSLVINDGINGTTISASSFLRLSASADGFGEDDNVSSVLEWFDCRTSGTISFQESGPSCMASFPQLRWGLRDVEISPTELSSVIMPEAYATFLSFGLRLSRGSSLETTHIVYRVVTADKEGSWPSLSSMKLRDKHGNRLDPSNVSHLMEITLQLEGESPDDVWRYSVWEKDGTDLNGDWQRGDDLDRAALTIPPGLLAPGVSYTIEIKLENKMYGQTSVVELLLTTRSVPVMTCTPPSIASGFASETAFVVSAETDFFSAEALYCFYLASGETGSRFAIGLGCSSARAAKLVWPIVGTYNLACELESTNGDVISTVKFEQVSEVLAFRRVGPDGAGLEQRDESSGAFETAVVVEEQSKLLDACERSGDHSCILQIVASLPELLARSSDLSPASGRVENDGEAGDVNELDPKVNEETLTLVEKLCSLLRFIGLQTVYTPDSIASTLDSAASIVQLPPSLFDEDALLSCVYSTSLAVEATTSSLSSPLWNERVLDSIRRVANVSITSASIVTSAGTSRERLSGGANFQSHGALFALFLSELPSFVARVLIQNEACGFENGVDTSIPGGSSAQPSVKMYLRVLCEAEDGIGREAKLQIMDERSGSDMHVSVCQEALAGSLTLPVVVKQTNSEQFCSSGVFSGLHSIFTSPTSISIPASSSLPDDCVHLRVPRFSDAVVCTNDSSGVEEVEEDMMSPAPDDTEDEISGILASGRAIARRYVPNLAGGAVSGLGTIRSGGGVLPPEVSVRIVNDGPAALVAEEWVSFRATTGGEFVAGFPRDPGETPTGVGGVQLVLYVGLIMGAFLVVVVGAVATRGCRVAGIPAKPQPVSQYCERDMWGRGYSPPDEEMTDLPGYVSDVTYEGLPRPGGAPERVVFNVEPCLRIPLPSSHVEGDVVASAPTPEELF